MENSDKNLENLNLDKLKKELETENFEEENEPQENTQGKFDNTNEAEYAKNFEITKETKTEQKNEPEEIVINLSNIFSKIMNFNKKGLFEKIYFVVFTLVGLFLSLMLITLFSLKIPSKKNIYALKSDIFESISKIIENLKFVSFAYTTLIILTIFAIILVVYLVLESKLKGNDLKSLLSLSNISSVFGLCLLTLGNICFSQVKKGISIILKTVNNLNKLQPTPINLSHVPSNTTIKIGIIFYTLALIVICFSIFTMFLKIFKNKELKIKLK